MRSGWLGAAMLAWVAGSLACGTPKPPGGPPCSPATCGGCCDGLGACVDGGAVTACGAGGQACSLCYADSQLCQNGACVTQGDAGG